MTALFLKFMLVASIVVQNYSDLDQAEPKPTKAAQAVYLVDKAARKRGDLSQIAVLGTSHLYYLPENFDISRFGPLLERLESWAPDRIAIESIAGHHCDYLRVNYFDQKEMAERFCVDASAAREALGMSGPEAASEIDQILEDLKANREPSERRRLAALFLIPGEPDSALVQWLRLPKEHRLAKDGLTPALIKILDERVGRKNENSIIAAPLAAKLGHERLYHVDDHSFVGIEFDWENYDAEMQEIWSNEWLKQSQEIDEDWSKDCKGMRLPA